MLSIVTSLKNTRQNSLTMEMIDKSDYHQVYEVI